jgi:hypothetical protein
METQINLFTLDMGEIIKGMPIEKGIYKNDELIKVGRESKPEYLMKIYLKNNIHFQKESRWVVNKRQDFVMQGSFSVDHKNGVLLLIPAFKEKTIFVLVKYRKYELYGDAAHVRKEIEEIDAAQKNKMYPLIEMKPGSSFSCWNTKEEEKRTLHYSDFIRI